MSLINKSKNNNTQNVDNRRITDIDYDIDNRGDLSGVSGTVTITQVPDGAFDFAESFAERGFEFASQAIRAVEESQEDLSTGYTQSLDALAEASENLASGVSGQFTRYMAYAVVGLGLFWAVGKIWGRA